MSSPPGSGSLVGRVDDVLITAELASRPSRAADFEIETRALGLLAQEMAVNPRGVLQKCAELVMELCHADSAGISILEPGGTSGLLRWHAAAGGFAPHLHGTMPREASPCGTVMERDCVLLFQQAERFFPALRGVEPRIYENLLAPWHVKSKAVGTIWVIKHTPEGRFDAEDSRLLQSLARFVAAAFQMTSALDEATSERLALRASEQQLRDVLDSLSEGFVLLDANFTILDVNAQTARLEGRTREELVGQSHWEAFAEIEDSPQGEMLKRVMRDRTPEAMEYAYSWRDGQTIWVDTRAYPTTHGNIAIQWRDITERKQVEDKLRESKEQQAFLLKLSDALRATPSADAAAYDGISLVLDYLGLDRCYLASYRLADDLADITHQVGTERVPELPWEIRLSDFPEAFRKVFDRTLVIDDVTRAAGISETDRQNIVALGFGSLVAPTLRRGEKKPLWVLVAVSAHPRQWSAGEVALLEEASERILAAMERAAAEAALRESEERFGQFANAASAGLWIRKANSLEMEFASPAIAAIYGVEPDGLLGDVKHWAALVVPEDRDGAVAQMEAARGGATAIHDFRIQRRSDGAFRWIRNTDFPLEDGEGRVQRIGGIAEDITEAKLAIEHQGVLLAELQHRVRNIMAIIRSMARRTADGALHVSDYRSLLEGRLLALARVQVLLTREANAGGSLREIIVSEVSAQAHQEDQFELKGPEIRLSPKAVEVLTLAVHELATNAVKYGAFSIPDGRLHVSWELIEKRGRPWLALDWTETGVPLGEPSNRRGFGSDLIEGRIPYELGGVGKLEFPAGGARCRMEFPLKDGVSVLATDAPMAIFGGKLDMTHAPDLTGRKVLIVEDDYYIAGDTAAALRGAGAEVLGPCPNVDATFDLLKTQTPTHAVLDLNLGGGGAKFDIAHLLKERGVPFIFMTGYDPDMVPPELEDVPRLQKPVSFRKIVEAVSQL